MFMGYLNDPGNTSSVVDADGYLSTGDVGHTDKFGFVYITGRIKVCRYISTPNPSRRANLFFLFFFVLIINSLFSFSFISTCGGGNRRKFSLRLEAKTWLRFSLKIT